jgi:hypothetical protein
MVSLQLGEEFREFATLKLGLSVVASTNVLAVNKDLGNSLGASHVLGERSEQIVTTCAMRFSRGLKINVG